MVQPEWMFEITDYAGTPVVLSRATWHAKAGNDAPGTHPEIRGYLEEVRTTIASPNRVFASTSDARSRLFYRLGAGRGGDFAGTHVVVVVKYVQEATSRRGSVGTVYLSRAVYARGVQLWPRTEKAPE